MIKLLKYLRSYKKECILGPLFKMLEAIFELFVPLVVAAIIDKGIADRDSSYITGMCILMAALGAIGLANTLFAQYFAAKAATGFAAKLRHALLSHVQKLSYSDINRLGSSTLITRMTSDINQVQTGTNLAIRLLLRSPFIVFGAMIMAFTVDVRGAFVFVVTIPVLSVIVFGIMLISIPMFKKVQNRLDRVMNSTRENLSGVRVIRAFGQEEAETESFEKDAESLTSMQKTVGRISALMNPLTYVVINLAVIALIWTGAVRVEAGLLTQGAVVALYNYMSQILVELIKLANLIINLTKTAACGNRIQRILEINPSQQFADESDRAEITAPSEVCFENVTFTYEGASLPSVSDVSFTAKKGDIIGIIGGTGSGKSTLVNLIPRFYDADSGKITVGGIDVNKYPKKQLRESVGIVPQKSELMSGTIRDNLLWGKKDASDEEITEALKAAQALDVVQSKSKGLDEVITEGGRNLSGGQKQRLCIARAIVRKPDILILDDSASALDYGTEASLRSALRKLSFQPVIFIVSQRIISIKDADKILVMDDGKLAGSGTHSELLESCTVYREIYNSQQMKEGQAHEA
ncbi:MAG: ABC transporter ATP-binding protein [Oscillospiraceae bacterium]|nr:ABC transporter ATP-binding protein [Oscillospiraceae bacterium]